MLDPGVHHLPIVGAEDAAASCLADVGAPGAALDGAFATARCADRSPSLCSASTTGVVASIRMGSRSIAEYFGSITDHFTSRDHALTRGDSRGIGYLG